MDQIARAAATARGRGHRQRAARRTDRQPNRLANFLLERFAFGLSALALQQVAWHAVQDHMTDGMPQSSDRLQFLAGWVRQEAIRRTCTAN